MVAIEKPEIAPAPNKNTYIIAALILVPIAILFLATFVAIKTTSIFSSSRRNWAAFPPVTAWARSLYRPRRLKHHKSSDALQLQQTDSFYDLESVNSPSASRFKKGGVKAQAHDLESDRGTPSKLWHPSRSTRLNWSFGRNSKKGSKYHGPYESSNALVPTPPKMAALASARERSLSHDGVALAQSAQVPLAHSRRDHSDV